MTDDRATLTLKAIEYVTGKPYAWGENDCIQLVRQVIGAIGGRDQDFPPYRNEGETLRECLTRWRRQDGSVFSTMIRLAHHHPQTKPVGIDRLRPGDIWVADRGEITVVGAAIGVIAPDYSPVHWTEDNVLETLDPYPAIFWTYDE